ncbi:hypothetical protein GGX14DRAFT_635293 [Mycena pura]|uniref:Uncharacterized protein n=1 Tax=Mycena pura TaxID=153505 RepID=A0AAD6Y9S8_9AGAR|nr:hypothetical protein GGX14DRAFT_635293 [Mycena pura]
MNVIGLLGTTMSTNMPDGWGIVTDFHVWKHILSDTLHVKCQCIGGIDFDSPGFSVIMGDPYANHISFNLDQTGITHVPTIPSIKVEFLLEVAMMLGNAGKVNFAVIVICSHGEPNGDICLGAGSGLAVEHLEQIQLEMALDQCACPICAERLFIVSTACYSGQWRSPHWTLLAAAECNQQSNGMWPLASGETSKGFFTWAALAGQADEHGLSLPLAGEIVYPSDYVFPLHTDSLLCHPLLNQELTK